MIPLLWAAIGISVGAALLHATLGSRRPLDRAYLLFACMMGFLAVYFFLGLDLYRAPTADAAVGAVRRQVIAVLGCHACTLAFVPVYTRVRIPQSMMAAFGGVLAVLFVANLLAPYGLWFSGPPQLLQSEFLGEPYESVVAPPMSLLQHAYTVYFITFMGVALTSAVKLIRRGERQRGGALAAALVLIVVTNLIDIIRDIVGGSWPYVAEIGFVGWALIMSVQLAHDFRAEADALRKAISQVETHAEQLRSMLDALRALEENIHVSLATLEPGVKALTATTTKDDERLQRLCRAVARLRDVAHSMPDISARPPSDSLLTTPHANR